MADSSTADRILGALRAAQQDLWGTERTDALADSLRRMAGALATVEHLAVPAGSEPFPTGPEGPRG